MQAIVTYYLPATNFKGTRIKAKCQAGSITLGWDHALNHRENHIAAAKALATKLQWDGEWVSGELPSGTETVFVCANDRLNDERFTVLTDIRENEDKFFPQAENT